MTTLRRVTSDELRPEEIEVLRALFAAAWGGGEECFSSTDWDHTFGGTHFLLEDEGRILTHASVVPRHLVTGGVALPTGYVESVATWPDRQGQGHATAVMAEVDAHIDERFVLGALDTGRPSFYQRLGWIVWRGPTSVVSPSGGVTPTPYEDSSVMVRPTPATPPLDLDAELTCDWRPGDAW